MFDENEAKFAHSLNIIENVGCLRLGKLSSAFKSFKKAWEADNAEIEEKTADRNLAEIIASGRKNINPEKELEKLKKEKIEVLTLKDENYPQLLKEISHPPQILYYVGSIERLNENPAVSIVGTRRATRYGLEASFKIAFDLSLKNINIVSGLALGVDAWAHKGALEAGGATFAVLGSGVLNILPRTNAKMAEEIAIKGAVISEFPPFFPADKWTFPQRNRIVAGLSKVTIVVEAPEKSGALITARFALDANREVGAVPGEIFSINSKGANALLKNGACPVACSNDVLELIGLKEKEQTDGIFDETEKNILKCLEKPLDTNSIGRILNIDVVTLNQKLGFLEIRGAVKNKNGKYEIGYC